MNTKFLRYLSIYSLVVFIFVILSPIGSTGANKSDPVIDLSLKPTKREFKVDKMVPGDWATRTLTVQNNGNKDFSYQMTSSYLEGNNKFYNQLDLRVESQNQILFDGKLENFEGLKSRSLDYSTEEDITITVTFPYESGNEYQGLATSVLFTFVAEGDTPPPPPTSSDLDLDITLTGSCDLATATFENNSKKRSTIKPTYELRYSETDDFTTSEKIELENQKSISLKKGESDSINFTPTKTGFYKISAKHSKGKELSNELYVDMTDCDTPPPEPPVDVQLSSLFSGTCEEMTLTYTNESDSDTSISPSYEVYWKESGDAKQGVKITQYDQTDRFSVDQGDSHTLTMKPELPGNYVVKTTYELDGETVEMWSEPVTIPTNCDSDVPEDPEDPGDPGDETPETPDNPGDEPGDDGDPEQPGEPGDGDDGNPGEPGEPGDGVEGETPTPSPEPTPEDGSLPQTGEAAPTAFYIIGSLLMLGGATLYGITYRRRKIE
ncbi:LPXTG cell wall anchor domain-containing protein [Pontibacillus yanchengensis]|uniref:Gram-positive cocci surface proteins LPxTG domain-containing protein n=1 Tax=Pontibacillus yanchengensis Y32 TaxID=1385514 RepID=A0A0A2TJ62_9BACI|nr:LPXTG cell wall anchor domain-containing protein [Pontibacillus yanchengensis]KGP74121.1 hypothetical protein N782_17475 [Pontibacillus yanchengensis Y32]